MSSDAIQIRDAAPSHVADAAAEPVPPGYKRTDVGVIPADWITASLAELGHTLSGGTPRKSDARFWGGDIPWVSSKDMKVARLRDAVDHVTPLALGNGTRLVQPGTILMVVRGMSLAHSFPVAIVESPVSFNQDLKAFVPHARISAEYVLRWLEANEAKVLLLATEATHGTKRIPTKDLLGSRIPLPPTTEQRAIADALSDVDGLLGALEALIAKKRAIKQAAMQQLLTGKTRLPGFGGAWETKRLEHIADCLDNFRVPLNETQRAQMPGPYPYCGANGVLDYVGGFVLDEDVALIAEDGGYFDEYAHRPIAYRMSGKIWVNNHAHILKAKAGYSQGLLYFSLVHKNIVPYLASGTRAKLNKSEMNRIEVFLPKEEREQSAIATVLSDMDAEITALEARRDKTQAIKQGMMQQLLTGRVRLVAPEAAA